MSNIYVPGEIADRNMTLDVVDKKGRTLSKIEVQAGDRIPPTHSWRASGYILR